MARKTGQIIRRGTSTRAALPIMMTASDDSSLGPTVDLPQPVKEQCQPARAATAFFVFLLKSSRLLMSQLSSSLKAQPPHRTCCNSRPLQSQLCSLVGTSPLERWLNLFLRSFRNALTNVSKPSSFSNASFNCFRSRSFGSFADIRSALSIRSRMV